MVKFVCGKVFLTTERREAREVAGDPQASGGWGLV